VNTSGTRVGTFARAVYWLYALVCAAALTFDLLTDRSFGATMLAVVPIAMVAAVCLVAGPWRRDSARRSEAGRCWLASALLVLAVMFAFLGPEQAKVGGLVFTLWSAAAVVSGVAAVADPGQSLGPWQPDNPSVSIFCFWLGTVVLGAIEWMVLRLAARRLAGAH
jgi:hypothetical protein